MIPTSPPPATTAASILATPGWHLLAFRAWPPEREPMPDWEYCLGAGDFAAAMHERHLLWESIESGHIFAPQRRTPDRIEWLAIAITPHAGPRSRLPARHPHR